VPDQPSLGDAIDIGINAEIGLAVDVKGVQCDEDRGFFQNSIVSNAMALLC
jgi:hypothetical protein